MLFRIAWWTLLAGALAAAGAALLAPGGTALIVALGTVKSAVLIAVAAILYRRRPTDPVAAMLGLAFLLWTASSSVDQLRAMAADWAMLLDRLRFLPFALALLLFPDGRWQPRWTRAVAAAIGGVFLLGLAEAFGLLASRLYLPLAIGCVLAAIGALLARYRATDGFAARQQLKWVALGLVGGIGLILAARAGAALGPADARMALLFEALFQAGIVIVALGFLTSLLRFRLYDAEAAISRSAAYAGLTLALVATFAASEATLQTLGQRLFGPGIGDLSGGIAAAIAALMLTPLHDRISRWAEQHFQRDLAGLTTDLPDLLATLSATASPRAMAAAVLPRVAEALHPVRAALLVDGRLLGARGIAPAAVRAWARGHAPGEAASLVHDEDALFPLRLALRCPAGRARGWLLLGPRPDGSGHGGDARDALEELARPLQRSLMAAVERDAAARRELGLRRSMRRAMAALDARLEWVEQALSAGSPPSAIAPAPRPRPARAGLARRSPSR